MLSSWISRLKSVKWKNGRAAPNCAYNPTTIEHCANILTHGVWIVPSLYGCYHLLERSKTPTQFLAALLYGSSLILCFSVSTFFHSVFLCNRQSNLKDILHRCDRAVIYIFIAGSYCPWAFLMELPADSYSNHVSWLIWVLASCGICYQQLYHERYKMLDTIFYCCIGVLPALLLTAECTNLKAYQQLRNGGVIYLIGIVFFKADGRIPCAHAIWHCFVAAAAFVHYVAITHYLFPDPDPTIHAAVGYLETIQL